MSSKLKSLALLGSLFSCVLAGHVGAAELKLISQVQIPGAPLDSFDISYVDQETNRYYLADRSNSRVPSSPTLFAAAALLLGVRKPGHSR
jgi:hypothetical protein